MPGSRYRRVLLKLSGEALQGEQGYGIDPPILNTLADQMTEVVQSGVELAVVIGGGNIFRGLQGAARGMDRAHADYMGMLATMLNSLALQEAMERRDVYTRVLSAIEMKELAEPYIRRRAVRHLEKGRVVIFGAGTGNPYFTTDTAAALRAMEINADVLLKATKVDGVYDRDPAKHPDAVRYDRLSYLEVISRGLGVMDSTAISLCKENDLPIVVFNMLSPGNIMRVVQGETLGTYVSSQNEDQAAVEKRQESTHV